MKYLGIILGVLLSLNVIAQSNSLLPLTVTVEHLQEPFPEVAKKQMINKLNQLMTQNGVVSLDGNNHFILTVFVVPQDKDILPGPPTQIVETMDMTFYIADVATKKVFATTSQTVKAMGTTESRTYMDAIKHMRIETPDMAAFIRKGQEQIIAYYDQEAPLIFKQVEALSQKYQYEEALWLLLTIPEHCKAYGEALALSQKVFQQYQDRLCQQNIQQARMLWAAEQNAKGAQKAGELLAQIYPDAGCYSEAMTLYDEMKNKVHEDWSIQMQLVKAEVDLEKQRIEAARQVGIAYGQHQQPTTYNYGFLR